MGLAAIALLVLALLPLSSGLPFTIILALLGMFLYSINPVMLAATLDAVPRGTEASATALMFTGPAIFGAISPVIAGRVRELSSMDGVFLYIGVIAGFVAVVALFVPMRRALQFVAA